MKISERLDQLRLKANVWARERKERAEERREQQADPPGVTVFRWQVRSAHALSWLAAATAAYFLWTYCIDVAGDQATAMHVTHAGTWIGDLQFFFPLLVGFVMLSVGIPYLAKSIIPIFVVLTWKEDFWPKLWTLVLVIGASGAIIAGSFSVMGGAIIEQGRPAAVAVEGVTQNRAQIQAQIDGITADLRASTEGNGTQAQAARVGMLAGSAEAAAQEWTTSYVVPAERAQAYNTELLRRATGSARAAGAAVARREGLRQQLAGLTVAAVETAPATSQTTWIVQAMDWVKGAWALILSVLNDIVCLLMGWIAYRLERKRSVQMGLVEGIALHPYMLTDQHETTRANRDPQRRSAQDVAEAMIAGGADPRFAADMARSAARSGVSREAMYDAETGEELVQFKGGWRRKPKKKGVPEQMQMPPGDPMPDETGVEHDGGQRTATLAEALTDIGTLRRESVPSEAAGAELDAATHEAVNHNGEANDVPEVSEQNSQQDEPFSLPEDSELLADFAAEPVEQLTETNGDAAVTDDADQQPADPEQGPEDGEQNSDHDELTQEPEREPEQRPERLIAAE